MHRRRKWQPTPVFLPGESQGLGKPGGLPSMGLHRVGHNWSDLAAAAAASWFKPFKVWPNLNHPGKAPQGIMCACVPQPRTLCGGRHSDTPFLSHFTFQSLSALSLCFHFHSWLFSSLPTATHPFLSRLSLKEASSHGGGGRGQGGRDWTDTGQSVPTLRS